MNNLVKIVPAPAGNTPKQSSATVHVANNVPNQTSTGQVGGNIEFKFRDGKRSASEGGRKIFSSTILVANQSVPCFGDLSYISSSAPPKSSANLKKLAPISEDKADTHQQRAVVENTAVTIDPAPAGSDQKHLSAIVVVANNVPNPTCSVQTVAGCQPIVNDHNVHTVPDHAADGQNFCCHIDYPLYEDITPPVTIAVDTALAPKKDGVAIGSYEAINSSEDFD